MVSIFEPKYNAPRTQSLRDRVLKAYAELTVYGEHGRTKVRALDGPPVLLSKVKVLLLMVVEAYRNSEVNIPYQVTLD